ncbi:hypothetical protein [Amycolatopsis sp. cmx-4-54]|uniref:hypothetical protein n=1 Tax=Amycolatopsis sp. cmx-4-54 TaxID=2790936 RepID=UPI00397C35F1
MAEANREDTIFSPAWAPRLIEYMNKHHTEPFSVVTQIYWPFSATSLRGVLSRIRTALVELSTELADLTPPGQEIPAQEAADQVVQFIITGDRAVITYSPQITGDHGTNITASGAHSTAVGGQTVTGDNNTTAGRDATAPAKTESCWTRTRKRGLFVALFTIVAGVLALLTYLGLTPSPTPPKAPPSTTAGSSAPTTPGVTTSR